MTERDLWEAYRDTLEWGLDSVDVLRQNCKATIALSADHGNGMGEWGVWSHPPGSPVPALRKVPWVTVPGTDERTVEPESIADTTSADEELSVEERLTALGYA